MRACKCVRVCMRVPASECVCACVHVCTYVRACLRACVCVRACVCACVYACVCVRVCMRRVCMCMRVCVCARMRVRACVQALQVCMPALVCKCRHVCAIGTCGALDILAGTVPVVLVLMIHRWSSWYMVPTALERVRVCVLWSPKDEFEPSSKRGHEPNRSESMVSILARAISENYYSTITKRRSLIICMAFLVQNLSILPL